MTDVNFAHTAGMEKSKGAELLRTVLLLCAAPCRRNMPLCGAQGAQQVGEDESSLLDFLLSYSCDIRIYYKKYKTY